MRTSWSVVVVKAKRLVLPVLVILSVCLSGCQAVRAVMYLFAPADKGQWIPAECEALIEGKRVLTLVYADQAIQYQQGQLARYTTAAVVAAEMKRKLHVDVVDPAVVEQYQAANINWADQTPVKMGQRYQADFVLYIELVEFSTAVESSGDLLRGRMEAGVSLYSVNEEAQQLWQGDVRVVYPANNPEVADIGVAERIYQRTLELFAERLVKHFYGHQEPS